MHLLLKLFSNLIEAERTGTLDEDNLIVQGHEGNTTQEVVGSSKEGRSQRAEG